MILFADAGNSRLKWSFYNAGQRSKQYAKDYSHDTADILLQCVLKKCKGNADQILTKLILVSVLGEVFAQKIQYTCEVLNIELELIRSQASAYGISNRYIEPQRLGADRFVGLIAAHHLRANADCIVISCGTAVTLDAITAQGKHLGGMILPGLAQFSDQLIKKTALLNVQQTTKITLFSDNTADALASGRVYGLVGAINGISSRMKIELLKINDLIEREETMYSLQIILCGGDAEYLHPYFDISVQCETDWLMQGLQCIAEFDSPVSCSNIVK